MRILTDAIHERYLKMLFNEDYNIGTIYKSISDDLLMKYKPMKLEELRKQTKIYKNLTRFYDRYVFESNEAMMLDEEVYQGVLLLYARANHLIHNMSYAELLGKDELMAILTELTIIETIFKSLFKDNHTDENLRMANRSAGYMYYTDKTTRVKYSKQRGIKNVERYIFNAGDSVQEVK